MPYFRFYYCGANLDLWIYIRWGPILVVKGLLLPNSLAVLGLLNGKPWFGQPVFPVDLFEVRLYLHSKHVKLGEIDRMLLTNSILHSLACAGRLVSHTVSLFTKLLLWPQKVFSIRVFRIIKFYLQMSTLVLELAENGPVHWAHVIPYINISIVGFVSESVGFYMLIS